MEIVSYRDGIYQGETVRGKKNGLGVCQKISGMCYFGDWKDDCMHGEGMVVLPVGYILRGRFVQGKLHGNVLISTPVF